MNAFPVPISSAETVGELKDKIKTKKAPRFDDVAADELSLWRVSIPDDDDDDEIPIDKKKLRATRGLLEVFPDKPPKNTIHVIVERPPSGDLRADIEKIADRFFAAGSPASDFLDANVRGEFKLPITTSGIKGLPKVLRRGVTAK
ncbi:hypothetical protein BGZ97_007676, partial [Linnemannia gamsii]